MLSQTVEYALRAAVYLAGKTGTPQTNDQIATATKVPAAYLSKVLQSLTRAGLVAAQRGVRGGFTLCRAADELTILEVVNAVAQSMTRRWRARTHGEPQQRPSIPAPQ